MSAQGGEERVVVLDFGAQYNQLIARRVRECGVYSEILPYTTTAARLREMAPRGIILSGGPASVYDPGAPRCDRAIFDSVIPVLGICYGMQLMAMMLGGEVSPAERREYGKTTVHVVGHSALFHGLEGDLTCWMSHGDVVRTPPRAFDVVATSESMLTAAMADDARRLYGVQFHPEVVHTPWGMQIFRNFLFGICGCEGRWTMASFVGQAVEAIRAQTGGGRVICALSGGVDSAVAAVLVQRAVGDRLTCIFVDHGMLRQGEAEQVVSTFGEHFQMNLVHVQAAGRFLERLRGVTDPEEKRRIIGEEFIAVFEDEAAKIGEVEFLAQGTIYPDVIESGSETAARIKSHHNVGGLPQTMKLKLVEPLRTLFKDEVRALGEELGLPEEIVWRQPYPGPGLAVRILGEVTRERLETLRQADAIVLEEIRRAGLIRSIWQSFAVLAPLRSVGVMGDARTYGHLIVLRAVESEDAMTAHWVRLPYEVLERISSRISNEVAGVNRVVYDITSKPPATIEWE